MLCCQNDDPSAELHATLLADTGIPVAELLPWNAYPWYVNRKPTGAELDAAAETLKRLIDLAPRLTVVMLHGDDVRAGWRRFARQFPTTTNRLVIVETYHTSRQAFWHKDHAVHAQRPVKLDADFAHVADLLRAGSAA